MKYNIHKVPQNPQNLTQSIKIQMQNQENCSNLPNKPITADLKVQNYQNETQMNKNQASEIISPYALNPYMFSHSEISQVMRAKLRLWIIENCHLRSLSRQTSSLACSLLDLYFCHGNDCASQQLHQLGICCLIVANKMEDYREIIIDHEIFPKQTLLQIEQNLLFKIGFHLNPITHVQIASRLVYQWKIYCKESNKASSKIHSESFSKVKRVIFSQILLNELLDFALLTLSSFNYEISDLVVNCFYLILSVQYAQNEKLLNYQKVKKMLEPKCQILKIVEGFLEETETVKLLQFKAILSDQICLFLYPLYNSMAFEHSKVSQKCSLKTFNPNHPVMTQQLGKSQQPLIFKRKYQNFKRYTRKMLECRSRRSSDLSTKQNIHVPQ